MLNDLESDRVERTISTTNTDKFGQAITAFANDLAGQNLPGYLIIGVEDNGRIHQTTVTDELLKNIAAIRTDGNIQPQPSMAVEKMHLPGGDIIVVEVQPSAFPPVKYKGRIWVRIGPRKSVANEDDERRLYEKRASNISTFDAMPHIGATVDDLDTDTFRQIYLPKAIPYDVLKEDQRPIKQQMQALGFYNCKFDCPTNAGIILFGRYVEQFIPGAYVQYVRFAGHNRAADIRSEYKFAGNLCQILFRLDTFVSTTIANRRPVPVSALREETLLDYPHWATRELLMNAICHRDYTSNGPVQFYQYDNRIELLNPGNLYGKANAANFPTVNDYRNPVVAEAMKVLGFVNRFSRGIARVQADLKANNNGEAIFDLSPETAFSVTILRSTDSIAADEAKRHNEEKDIANKENVTRALSNDNSPQTGISEEKSEEKNITNNKDVTLQQLSQSEIDILQYLKAKPSIKYSEIANLTGISESRIYRLIAKLKTKGYITRANGRKHGHWIVK